MKLKQFTYCEILLPKQNSESVTKHRCMGNQTKHNVKKRSMGNQTKHNVKKRRMGNQTKILISQKSE